VSASAWRRLSRRPRAAASRQAKSRPAAAPVDRLDGKAVLGEVLVSHKSCLAAAIIRSLITVICGQNRPTPRPPSPPSAPPRPVAGCALAVIISAMRCHRRVRHQPVGATLRRCPRLARKPPPRSWHGRRRTASSLSMTARRFRPRPHFIEKQRLTGKIANEVPPCVGKPPSRPRQWCLWRVRFRLRRHGNRSRRPAPYHPRCHYRRTSAGKGDCRSRPCRTRFSTPPTACGSHLWQIAVRDR
jgi:hypothetical protein